MIHGSQMNSYDWRDNIGFFAKKHKVYAIDMIGCGWSDKPKGEYSPNSFAEFIKDFMNHLNIDKAVFIASSWGGGPYVAFYIEILQTSKCACIIVTPCGYKHKLDIMHLLRFPVLGRIYYFSHAKWWLKTSWKRLISTKAVSTKLSLTRFTFLF